MLYAIGDIHGCLSSLQDLLGKIEPTDQDTLVFLGDYIDRGQNTREVVDFLLERRRPLWRFLRGNHEQMLLDWLGDPSARPSSLWLLNGGLQTLRSYAPSLGREALLERENDERLRAAFPESHRAFFCATELFVDTPEAFFCHAGVDLGKPLGEQSPEVLMWVRKEFWDDRRPCPKLVVSGHTPRSHAVVTGDRINLDTGCVYGGPLTALRLPDRRLIQTLP